MKKSLVLFALFFCFNPFTNATPDLYNEISRKVYINFSNVNLGEDQQEVVYVEFHVIDNKIIVDDVLSENDVIEGKLLERLNRIKINSNYQEGFNYRIKICFLDESIC